MTKVVRDILYVASDPYAGEDDWCNAFGAFPDRKPLAQLMRTIPVPQGTINLLAEMLDPRDPPITDYELVPRRIKKFDTMLDHLEIVQTYADKREAGQSAQDAAIETAQKYRIGDRTVFNHLGKMRRLVERLKGQR
jgi:hypothetical protein